MLTEPRLAKAVLFVAVSLLGCEKEEAEKKPEAVKTAAPAPTPTPVPTPTPPPPEPKHDCPEGSSGVGSFEKPCESTGAERMMEVTWTGKYDDKGNPSFRVVSKSKLVILYGKMSAYFYDKAGKQLDVAGAPADKPKRHQDCPGNIFGGVMNAGEKATITFSCVSKTHVPEGTAAIEGEIKMVGFADSEGKKSEFYWKNDDLAPDERPKGGVKPAKKK